MNFLPSLRVLRTKNRVIVQQRLHYLWIGFLRDGQVNRREPFGVTVIRRGAQLQESPVK